MESSFHPNDGGIDCARTFIRWLFLHKKGVWRSQISLKATCRSPPTSLSPRIIELNQNLKLIEFLLKIDSLRMKYFFVIPNSGTYSNHFKQKYIHIMRYCIFKDFYLSSLSTLPGFYLTKCYTSLWALK